MKAIHLNTEEYYLATNSQDIIDILEYIGADTEFIDNITGVIYKYTDDGSDFEEIWVTESSRPYDLHADYEKVL